MGTIKANSTDDEDIAQLLRETADAIDRGETVQWSNVEVHVHRDLPAGLTLEVDTSADAQLVNAAEEVLP